MWIEDQIPIYLCAWHVLKVWHIRSMEKKVKQWHAMCNIGQPSHHHVHAHEPNESIEAFMICGRNSIIKNFTN